MKFLVPNYSCLQIPVLSVLCPQLNLLNPPPPPKKFLGTPLVTMKYKGKASLNTTILLVGC